MRKRIYVTRGVFGELLVTSSRLYAYLELRGAPAAKWRLVLEARK